DRVKLKPGKPVTFGKKGRVLFFGLPGNPVSAAVSFYLLVRPALRAMQGERYVSDSTIPALAGANLKAVRGRDTYLPVKVKFTAKGIIA
ncbi:molybdopterin molybdotransferase, partial [Escherichia coli]|nr:molybdopterin molybdotransferase [Escherichia coli]